MGIRTEPTNGLGIHRSGGACDRQVNGVEVRATVCLDDKGSDRALTVATSSKSNKVDADDDGQNEASARWVRRLLPCEDGP